ncbi:flagellar basal body P-ring biosynthesis protein FlgA [Luteitalea pratensis]|uniref:Flagella basal body P-ring formation protein FlgA n=2 Tax=Luteitalea pratensis TaxID=1855912 RepID=A0A143PRG6_LUTPR|nr:flagellar basal body P-ring biosynthesis protein FlgA [Luteitalea pratensis]
MGLAASVWLAVAVPAGAQTSADVDRAAAVATAAVREAFGVDAEVTVSEPVLSVTGDATLVTRAVPEPSSRTAGPVRFVLYAAGEGPARRIGRLTARIDVAASHVRARQRVAMRSVINPDDVEVVRGDIGRQVFGVLPTMDAVTGVSTRKTLMPGEVITPVALVAHEMVASGEEVVTIARIGAIEVRGRAIAAQSGGLGETVIVVNPDSRKRLRARIVAAAMVEVFHGS